MAAATTTTVEQPGMAAGGQGIPMAQSGPSQGTQAGGAGYAQTTYTQTTYPQQGYQQQQGYQHGGQQQQGGFMGGGPFQQMPQALMGNPAKSGDNPALAEWVQQPEEPTAVESCNTCLVVFAVLCATASTILCGLAGSFTIGEAPGWQLALSATVITAVGVVFFEILKRLWANTTVDESINGIFINVLSHASIRAVAVRALATTHVELKKAECALRDAEVIVVVVLSIIGAILSGIAAVYYDVYGFKVLAIIAAYFNGLVVGLLVLFEIAENAKRTAAQKLEDQLRRNNLVADFLRADPGRKHTLLQDRVEALAGDRKSVV